MLQNIIFFFQQGLRTVLPNLYMLFEACLSLQERNFVWQTLTQVPQQSQKCPRHSTLSEAFQLHILNL